MNPRLAVRIAALLAIFLITPALPLRAEFICNAGLQDPVAANDSYEFPAAPTAYAVMMNDYDPGGLPITIVGVSAPVGGTAEVTGGGTTVTFSGLQGAQLGQFTYRVRNSAGREATAQVRLGGPPETPIAPATISITCDSLTCNLMSNPPSMDGIRTYRWRVYKANADGSLGAPETNCSKEQWPNRILPCMFSSGGLKAIFHEVAYHDGRVALTNPPKIIHNLVVTPPSVSWTWDNADRNLEVKTSLVSTSAPGVNNTYQVEWGDGSPRQTVGGGTNYTLPYNMPHTYVNPGLYTVTYYHVQSGAAYPKQVEAWNAAPTPRFTPQSIDNEYFVFHIDINAIDEFGFTGAPGGDPSPSSWSPYSPVRWEFDFGDGESRVFHPEEGGEESSIVRHYFPNRRAKYTVRLQITDHLGLTGTSEQEITVANTGPEAQLDFACRGLTCRFDASRSTDSDGSIVGYDWRVEYFDETLQNTYYYNSYHTTGPILDLFAPPREFTVSVFATDNQGTVSRSPAVRRGSPHYASATTPLAFYAIEPCAAGGGTVADGAPTTVIVRGQCGIPNDPDIVAVALTVHTSNPTYPGIIWVGKDKPYLTFDPASSPRSNLAVLPVYYFTNQASAWVRMYPPAGAPTGSVRIMYDAVGYYRRVTPALPPASSGSSTIGPLWYRPVSPCVLYDTRTEPPALSGTARRFDFTNRCGFTGAEAAGVFQMAAVAPVGGGSILMSATGTTPPTQSASMDVASGRTISTSVFTGLAGGTANVASTITKTDLVLATSGAMVAQGGDAFYLLGDQPCRLFDTRKFSRYGVPRLKNGEALSFQLRGTCGVPVHASAVMLQPHVVNAEAEGHLQVFASGIDAPRVAAVTFGPNQAIGNTVVVPFGHDNELSALLTLYGPASPAGADLVIDVYGYYDGRRNVAAAASGAQVFASSSHSSGNFPPASMIDGERRGLTWGQGGGWSDGTPNAFPDFVEVHLAGEKLIDEIVLYTLRDNYTSADEVIEASGATQYGLSAFDVGYWDAAAGQWKYIAVTGNPYAIRRVVLPAPVSTSKLSIVTRGGGGGYSRIVEIEAYEVPPRTPAP